MEVVLKSLFVHNVYRALRQAFFLCVVTCQWANAQPVVGQIYKEFLPMGSGASVPLPEGVWKSTHSDRMMMDREVWDVYVLKNEIPDDKLPYLVVRREGLPRQWGSTPCNRANASGFMLNEHGTMSNGLLQKCSRAFVINDFQNWKNIENWNAPQSDKDWWKVAMPGIGRDSLVTATSILLMEMRVQQFNGGQMRVEAFVLPPLGATAAQFRNQFQSGAPQPEHEMLSTWAAIYVEAVQQSFFNKKPQAVAALAYPVRALAGAQRVPGQQTASTVASAASVMKTAPPATQTAESKPVNSAGVAADAAARLGVEQERRAMEEDKRKMASQLESMAQMLAKLQQENAAIAAKAKDATAQVTPTPAKPVNYANRKALVIGNDLYTDVSPLNNAVADADAMTKALEVVGYKVFRYQNLNEKKFKQAIRDFRQQLSGGEEALFFYAGHGVQLNGANYLLPVDIKGENEDQVKDDAILLQKILDDLEDKKAKFALAVIDACRDNPFKSKGRALGGRGLAPTTAATGQMVIFSAGFGQQALDRLGEGDKEKNGLFTRIFVKEMMKPGLSVDRVVRNVRNEVVRLARSVGHDQIPALYDQAIGEFYFRQ